ncbi:MAG: LysR substrate-binding domain-containing protein [Myxococcota bacterium]
MQDDKLLLPPFRALLAFHAAATHERMVEAADSLGVTESAVSHQLRQLEDLLHAQLFDRSSGRLRLTDTGRRYLARIEPALLEIQRATEDVAPTKGRSTVRVTLPPSLAVTWLIPRLGRFEAAHPDLDIQLVPTTRVVDMGRQQIDAAIRYGKGAWPKVNSLFLFDDLATPVAASGFLPATAKPSAAVLASTRLIVNRSIPAEWEEWARARGIAPPSLEGALYLDSIEQVLCSSCSWRYAAN